MTATLWAVTANAEPIGSGLAAYLTFDEAVVSNRVPNSTITGITLSESGIESGVRSGKFRFFASNSSGVLATVAENDSPAFKLLYDAVGDRWPFYLGQDGSGSYGCNFEGKLDEFALWTRGLSPVAPTDSSCTFALPEAIKNEGRYYRFFLTKDAAYQEIEYVQNTGSTPSAAAYISTGIRPDKDTTVVTEVEIVDAVEWDNVFGCCDTGNKHYFQLGFYKMEMRWYEESTKDEPGIGKTISFGDNIEFGVRYCHDYAVTGVTHWNSSEGGAAGFRSMISDRTRFTDSANALAVFACEKIDGSLYDTCFLGKVYSFVISTNGMVACDYVPARRATVCLSRTVRTSPTRVAFVSSPAC